MLSPGGSQTLSLKSLFAGYEKAPVYTVDGGSDHLTCSLSGDQLTLTASGTAEGLVAVTLTVTDSEGSTMTRNLGIAITGDPTGIRQVVTVKAKPAPSYNLQGQRVSDSYHGVIIRNGKKKFVK